MSGTETDETRTAPREGVKPPVSAQAKGGAQAASATDPEHGRAVAKRAAPDLQPAENQAPRPLQAASNALQGPWRMPPVRWVEEVLKLEDSEIKNKRRKGFLLRFALFVLLPTALSAVYVFWYATPRYVSEFQVAYQSNDPNNVGNTSSFLSSVIGTGATDMSRVLASYFSSSAVAEKVNKQLNLRNHYSNSKIDWLDRLAPDASSEQFLDYFNKRVSVHKEMGGYVTVDVEAFDSAYAQKIGKAMVSAASEMVAGMEQQAHEDAVAVAATELKRAEDRLRRTTADLAKFRDQHRDVNIEGSSNMLDSVVGGLESKLSKTYSDLTDARTFMAENSPTVVALKARIAALEKQIDVERRRLGSVKSGSGSAQTTTPYSQIIAAYSALNTEHTFATDSYVSAKKAYDLARAAAALKAAYLVNFVPPNLPQASTSPNALTDILSTFVLALFAYTAGSLLLGALRDQAGI